MGYEIGFMGPAYGLTGFSTEWRRASIVSWSTYCDPKRERSLGLGGEVGLGMPGC